jgi:hypothetical protein
VTRRRAGLFATALSVAACAGCATPQPYDYTAYRSHFPRSILVLPPRNESVDVDATYSYLATLTMPLAEAGYYVYPVAVIDQFLRDNGLPTADEMHTVSLVKVAEIIGADSVLYVTVEDWGQKYQILSSTTVVKARAKLVDVATGTTLWEGTAAASEGSGGSSSDPISMLIVAAVEQVLESGADKSHDLSRRANAVMVFDEEHGLLYGPRSPKYESDARGR